MIAIDTSLAQASIGTGGIVRSEDFKLLANRLGAGIAAIQKLTELLDKSGDMRWPQDSHVVPTDFANLEKVDKTVPAEIARAAF